MVETLLSSRTQPCALRVPYTPLLPESPHPHPGSSLDLGHTATFPAPTWFFCSPSMVLLFTASPGNYIIVVLGLTSCLSWFLF